ncbi:MAG: hypothetical protein C0594_14975 [Marinilabiliales bacterium]|nr:MAG: hypothetical protein C0594_14975 [Marinilabiliales bacterium]
MKKILLLIQIVLIASITFAAGDNFMSGARQASMGNSGVMLSDVWSMYHNQAGIARIERFSLGVNYNSEFALSDLSNKSIALVAPVQFGSLGLSMSHYGFSEFSETKIGLAYAKAFNKRFSMGIQMDYLLVSLPSAYGTKGVPVAEIGILSEPIDNFIVAAHVYNPTRAKIADFNDERIPTIMKIGVGYRFSETAVVTAETEKDMEKAIYFKAGMEYMLVDNLYLRAGVSTNPLNRYAFGVGYGKTGFRADFAFSYHDYLGITPHLSMSYTFGKASSES